MQLKELGESGVIARIKNLVDLPAENLRVGIDDDAAVFKTKNNRLTLLTTDAFIEGVHFDLNYFNFYQLGWRALAANLSDIAAMGGLPRYAVVSLGLPQNLDVSQVDEFYRGMKTLGEKYGTRIVGGDTTKSPERIFISVTVVGEVEPDNLSLRSGAQVGDAVFVTGNPGSSRAGLKVLQARDSVLEKKYADSVATHLTPEPRINEARFLAENFPIHAMIDVSDGVASEINHLCKSSDVGAAIFFEEIPISKETNEIASNFAEQSLDYALSGGEDFELIFTISTDDDKELSTLFCSRFELACTKIGEIKSKDDGILWVDTKGDQSPMPQKGYEHFK